MNGGEAEGIQVLLQNGWAADQSELDICCGVVGGFDRKLDELAKRNVDVGFGELVLQGAVGDGAVGLEETDGLVELELAELNLVQDGNGEGKFKCGLHGRMAVLVEVAIELSTGE